MKYIPGLLFLLLLTAPAAAKNDMDYAVSKISSELLVNACAVVREHTTEIEIHSLSSVEVKEHYAITILNEKGDRYSDCTEAYSNFKKIHVIYGDVYDADGKNVKTIQQGSFIDYPMFVGRPEYSDNKLKHYSVAYRKYPYTVEFTIESEQNHTFLLPQWSPQPAVSCAVENASLSVLVPDSIHLRYRSFHISGEPQVTGTEEKE